jgi:hypothetical protein
MARKHPLHCPTGSKRFTVIQVGTSDVDSHAGRSFEQALELAMPDRGNRLSVYVTCARSGSEARLPANYLSRGKLVRRFRFRGR